MWLCEKHSNFKVFKLSITLLLIVLNILHLTLLDLLSNQETGPINGVPVGQMHREWDHFTLTMSLDIENRCFQGGMLYTNLFFSVPLTMLYPQLFNTVANSVLFFFTKCSNGSSLLDNIGLLKYPLWFLLHLISLYLINYPTVNRPSSDCLKFECAWVNTNKYH